MIIKLEGREPNNLTWRHDLRTQKPLPPHVPYYAIERYYDALEDLYAVTFFCQRLVETGRITWHDRKKIVSLRSYARPPYRYGMWRHSRSEFEYAVREHVRATCRAAQLDAKREELVGLGFPYQGLRADLITSFLGLTEPIDVHARICARSINQWARHHFEEASMVPNVNLSLQALRASIGEDSALEFRVTESELEMNLRLPHALRRECGINMHEDLSNAHRRLSLLLQDAYPGSYT